MPPLRPRHIQEWVAATEMLNHHRPGALNAAYMASLDILDSPASRSELFFKTSDDFDTYRSFSEALFYYAQRESTTKSLTNALRADRIQIAILRKLACLHPDQELAGIPPAEYTSLGDSVADAKAFQAALPIWLEECVVDAIRRSTISISTVDPKYKSRLLDAMPKIKRVLMIWWNYVPAVKASNNSDNYVQLYDVMIKQCDQQREPLIDLCDTLIPILTPSAASGHGVTQRAHRT